MKSSRNPATKATGSAGGLFKNRRARQSPPSAALAFYTKTSVPSILGRKVSPPQEAHSGRFRGASVPQLGHFAVGAGRRSAMYANHAAGPSNMTIPAHTPA